MSSSNLHISSALANNASNARTRRTFNSTARKYSYKSTARETHNVNGHLTFRENYFNNLGVNTNYQNISTQVNSGRLPDTSVDWVDNERFYSNALELSGRLLVGRDQNITAKKGFADFISEFEKVIQRRVLNRDLIHDLESKEGDDRRWLQQQFTQSQLLVNIQSFAVSPAINQTVQSLTHQMRALGPDFWENQNYKNLWCSDFRHLLDDVVRSIYETFKYNFNFNHFGELIPRLQEYLPAMFEGTPTHRRPKGFIYKMDQQREFLGIIFKLMMIRLPSVNTSSPGVWKDFTMPIPMNRPNPESEIMMDSYFSNMRISYTDASIRNMFYYIPEQNRVLGIWPNKVRVSADGMDDGGPNLTTINVNYNFQMIRSVLVKLELSQQDRDSRSQIDWASMFLNSRDNIYTRIRQLDPFGIGPRLNPWVRFYTSMTFFSEANDRILHIPWVVESLHNPLDPYHGQDPRDAVPYEIDELLNAIQLILERRISGRNDEQMDNSTTFYLIIRFINEKPPDYYEPQVDHFEYIRQISENVESEEQPYVPYVVSDEEGEEETKGDGVVNIRLQGIEPPRQRWARTKQQKGQKPPKKSNRLDGMRVGAPYAGTKKEKIFLSASMMERFQFNDALFETPQRPMYTCFMMAVLRCQMYKYVYENGRCIDVLVTNGPKPDMTVEGKYVQAVMDYSICPKQYSFISKRDGEYYIRLFNNIKYPMPHRDGKYYSGAMDETEIQFWEQAAEEIWIHLERFRGHAINYTNLGEFGQAFADMFGVCICIYDIEYRGKRVSVIRPHYKTPAQLAESGEILMIHIVFDQGHIHAVNNLRNFIRSKFRTTDVRQYHYCPVCDGKQLEKLIQSKKSALEHITECTHENEEFSTGFKKEVTKQQQTQTLMVKFIYKKVKGKMQKVFQCTQCHMEVDEISYLKHTCYIQPKKPEVLLDQNFWVFDLEAAQIEDQYHLLKHECNCGYLRKVYCESETEKEGIYFRTEDEFIDLLMTQSQFQNAIIFAHNGGKYDIHFILRVLERSEIEHTYVPSPTSNHNFISITIEERNVKFLDFMRFMPGSLKGIAESFKIPVSKGDFPHRFNNGQNDDYEGPIPPLFSEEDYWGMSSYKSQKQKDTFAKWFHDQTQIYCTCPSCESCNCQKKKWNFQEEIRKYCLLDVVVLAEVVKAYRHQCMNFEESENGGDYPDATIPWKAPRLDPFQFMTLPQLTLQTLVHGYVEDSFQNYGFQGITSYFQPERASWHSDAILWLERQATINGEWILHRGNHTREFYDFDLNISIDGYAPESHSVYIYFKCSYWGCPHCMREYHENNWVIPDRQLEASTVKEFYELVMVTLNEKYRHVYFIWQHDFNTSFFNPYYLKCSQLMNPQDAFYGGRTEVFKMYYNSNLAPDEEIQYYDVTSLYPSVYAHKILPIGSPLHIPGYLVDKTKFHPTASDRYFGFARIKVIPPSTDRIGLLPQRDEKTNRLSFPVFPMEGCWMTEEIYLAMQNGYIVEEIYELYYWTEYQLSGQHLRGYVGFFLRMKQESEGWVKLGASSDSPSEQEQKDIAIRLYHQNGDLGMIRPEKVKVNPVARSLAKLYLNALWGKFAQKPAIQGHTTIYGTQQFTELWNDRSIDRESLLFRELTPGVYKVSYNKKSSFIRAVPHGNLWIAASVTAHARCELHRQILRIGPEKVIYSDTDSIIFARKLSDAILTGVGLGKWTNEYPDHRIVRVYALAPKLYALELEEKDGGTKESFRAKGVQMTLTNQEKMSFANIIPLLQKTVCGNSDDFCIEVDNFSIFTNSCNNSLPYGQIYSRYNKKNVKIIITKRTFDIFTGEEFHWDNIKCINTYPLGYSGDKELIN